MFRSYTILLCLVGIALAVGLGCDANDKRDPDAGTGGSAGSAGSGGAGGSAGSGGTGGDAGTGGSAGSGGTGGGTADPCSPNPCDDSNDCTVNACSANPDGTGGTGGTGGAVVCDFSGAEPDGTSCTDFAPNSGACVSGICTEVTPITDTVSLVCSNNVSPGELSYLPNNLTATPLGPVVNGNAVDVSFTGIGRFPQVFLNAAISTIPGLMDANITEFNATVVVRSGATGGPAVLSTADPLPLVLALDIENDNQTCVDAGFPMAPCILEDATIPLNTATVTLTPTGGAGGEILVGWDETLDPTTLPVTVTVTNPAGPNGIRLNALVVLQVGLECTMGECQAADPTCLGTGTDSGAPLTNAQLLSIPIAP